MQTPAIRIRDLSFTYQNGSRPALDSIDLEVRPGEVLVILGPSGAGKSTLCYCLNGLIPHFLHGDLTGEVLVDGRNTEASKVSDLAQDVGLVFQDFESQLFSTNVELEVAFGPENFGVSRDEIARRIVETLRTVNLTGLEGREPATLSGGQKQRLAIASVLSIEPKILCLDEPTTDLDPLGKEGVFEVARRLRDRRSMTLVIVEHETEEALSADRVALMEQGRITGLGPAAEVLAEVDRLERAGVQPLGVAQLCRELGEDVPALTVQDGEALLNRRGWRLDPAAVEAVFEEDRRRAANYGETVISARNLTHDYPNGVKALAGANLDIRRGEFVAVVGQNGSGKTTLVKHFNGLLRPTGGTLLVDGRDVSALSVFDLSRTVGYVFQNPDHQIFAETVKDEVSFGPRNFGLPPAEVEGRVAEALKAVGLEGMENEDPFSLTKGQRQRVAVASVLAAKPQVIILDEPTTGLDYREQRSMMELVRRLNEAGHTIIAVTHTMWVVAAYAHRMVVVRGGRIVMDGPTRQVMRREDELIEASLKPPQVVRLANRLLAAPGTFTIADGLNATAAPARPASTLLTVEEVRRCLQQALPQP